MPKKRPAQIRYTCQVPLALAARLEALFEMHPETEPDLLLADLLALGLAQVEHTRSGIALAESAASPAQPAQPGLHRPAIYLLTGPFDAFHGLVQKHHLALEHTQGDADTPSMSAHDYRLNPDD
jgi:hypothetical protein